MIRLNNISKTYNLGETEVRALRNIDLKIETGEMVSLLGPSGSGKSTLMNIIGCLDIADSGEYYLEEIEIEKQSENQLSEIRSKKIGFVFQAFNLLNDLTAFENVEMPLIYQRVNKQQRHSRVQQALIEVGLSQRSEHKPAQLSGGEQQRVAIARALVTQPALILADEPTGNLDSVAGTEIIKILERLWQQGNTILLITHDQSIAAHAKRRFYLNDGRLREEENHDR